MKMSITLEIRHLTLAGVEGQVEERRNELELRTEKGIVPLG